MKNIIAIKKIIRSIVPPILLSIYRYANCTNKQSGKNEIFVSWWRTFSHKQELSLDLIKMVDYFILTRFFKHSSKYWNWLNQKNIKQLVDYGYDNFKQTIAKNYFTWLGGLEMFLPKNFINNMAANIPISELLRKHKFFTLEESVIYNIITMLLYEHVKEKGGQKYLDMLEVSQEGNPPLLTLQGRKTSQDILNSILEYISIFEGCNIQEVASILEIGAGSGRTAYCLLTLLPNVKYIIVDIPPALYISQTYLANVFKDKKIFSFKPFGSFKEVEKEFHLSDIIFLMPDQLDLLPNKKISLFLAIDCLHEMKKEQIEMYFDQANSLADYFYFKCWQKTTVPFDNISYTPDDYPVKKTWKKIFQKDCEIPTAYFESFHELR